VWFWLFSRFLFDQAATLRPVHLSIVALVGMAGTWQQLIFLERYHAGAASTIESVVGFGFDATLALFVILALRAASKGMRADLVEGRRRLRIAFLAATGCYLAIALGVQSYNLAAGVETPHWLVNANLALIATAAAAGVCALLKLRLGMWLAPVRSNAHSLNRIERSVLERLLARMKTDRVFLSDGLTIGALAKHLLTQEHVLRRAINCGLGYRNFNEFLHDRRIRAACEELAQPEETRTPVLTIAMNVGYGSIGTFNRAFKARTGMTPTDFREQHLGVST
jgi:AraC-like DNA-binding protein